MKDARDRFFLKTKVADQPRPGMETPCLEWTAARFTDGYGAFSMSRQQRRAHRVAWEFSFGQIDGDLQVLHRCDNPICVRADHLFLGTPADNMRDRAEKGRNDGEVNGSAKLKASDIPHIFALRLLGWSQQRVADKFGVSQAVISQILGRKTWRRVTVIPAKECCL